MNNPDICYYHRVCRYNYWNIMKEGGVGQGTGTLTLDE